MTIFDTDGRIGRRAALLLLSLAVLLTLDRIADYGAERWTIGEIRRTAEGAVVQRLAVLRNEIEKQRTLPVVLVQDPDVRFALQTRDPGVIEALNAKLETLAEGTRTGAIYLLDATGLTIAASNYRTPISFVGSYYSFRPYYQRAMEVGSAEHFAFGTVSRQPGLYITRRIDGPGGPLGVLVVKAEFEAIEQDWSGLREPAFVTDHRDIVLVASEPDWRFQTIAPISAAQKADIRTSLQFGDATLNLLPFTWAGDEVRWQGRRFVEATAEVPVAGWRLHVLAPASMQINLATMLARAFAWLIGIIGLGAIAVWISRRRRQIQERLRQRQARQELEERVEARTGELREANDRLLAEAEERRRAEIALQRLQDELVQASKLAVLGQIAASVAHEINQPVAAIRTYAETGTALLAQGQAEIARGNLTTIISLTERIGVITGELRAFARKSSSQAGPVSLRDVVNGALLLVGHRIRQQAVELVLEIPADLAVVADRIRLEQVFVNLLQNALEALEGQAEGRIRIAAELAGDQLVVTVADNGAGLPPLVLETLFMPFTTTKPEGLGLGLVISRDIVTEFGGTLAAENRDGAVFTLSLPRLA